jgi:hypothetical protein
VRALTDAEKRADLLAIHRLLDTAKDDLTLQITAAQRSAISRFMRGAALSLRVTRRMMRLLQRLYMDGQAHAVTEASRMGVSLAVPPRRSHPVLAGLATTDVTPPQVFETVEGFVPLRPVEILRVQLDLLGRKMEATTVEVAASLSPARSDFAREMRNAAGARNAASLVVAPAFHDGLASVYAPHHERFDGWQYSAILDSHACGPCVDEDGRLFETLAEAQRVLPWFGGNPRCNGGTRCRCRLFPTQPLRLVA